MPKLNPLPLHISCGGIVWRKNSKNKIEVLLLYRLKIKGRDFDSWHLPKGTKEEDDLDDKGTAEREILEETGYQVKIIKRIGSLKSFLYKKDDSKFKKLTHYFSCQPIKRMSQTILEHDGIEWIELTRAVKLLSNQPKELGEEERILLKFKVLKYFENTMMK